MTTTNVSSSAALNSALTAAKAGDTILLAPGGYSLTAQYLNYAANVTVTSADASQPAVFTNFNVTRSSNITFDNVEFFLNGGGGIFQLSKSSGVTFNRLDVHGSLDGNALNDKGNGLFVRDSSNVSVTNSEFHELEMGFGHLNNSGLTLSGNRFHDIKLDGIRGGGSSVVKISGNTFSDFYPVAGDHPDVIQFWTTNVTTVTHDINITDNVILRGKSTISPQGIFLNDESGAGYSNITIQGNFLAGASYNGIAVYGAKNVRILDNDVVGFSDVKSFIRLDRSSDAVIDDNAANAFIVTASTGVTQTDNTLLALVTDKGAAAYAAWLAEHAAPTPPQPQPPSGIVGTAGADTLNGTSGSDSISGGAGADKLLGQDGADTISGGDGADGMIGGAGADVMDGGAGDDSYVVDDSGDRVVELVGGGVDKVQSTISFTLGTQVERLTLNGAGALTGTGNELANGIQGNLGANLLQGLAGADNIAGAAGNDTLVGGRDADTLTGGAGVDVFVFARGDGRDTIEDFGLGGEHDVIDVSAFYAAGLTATLTESAAGVTIAFTSGESILAKGAHLANLHATATGWVF